MEKQHVPNHQPAMICSWGWSSPECRWNPQFLPVPREKTSPHLPDPVKQWLKPGDVARHEISASTQKFRAFYSRIEKWIKMGFTQPGYVLQFAMENRWTIEIDGLPFLKPFIDGLPIKHGDFPWRTVSHNQMVVGFHWMKQPTKIEYTWRQITNYPLSK